MKAILGIDPGTRESAIVTYDPHGECEGLGGGCGLVDAEIIPNAEVVMRLSETSSDIFLAIEMFDYLGQDVGRDVFTTLVWIGRMIQSYYGDCDDSRYNRGHEECLIHRRDIKMHMCGTMRAKDKNIRQAVIDRFGGKEKAIGKKKTPGPLYGIKSHEWQALAVALTYHDRLVCSMPLED